MIEPQPLLEYPLEISDQFLGISVQAEERD
jgi:hypothetical protein